MSKPAQKQARLDCFLLSKETDVRTVVTADTAGDTVTVTPATSSATTVADASLDAVARVDIAHILELRLNKQLTLTEKIRLRNCVLQVTPGYQLPVQETTKQKYYLRHHHLSGGGNAQYDYFYFSPELQGVLCLACLLYAPEKVGIGNQSKLGVLVDTLRRFGRCTTIIYFRQNTTKTLSSS